MVDANVWIYSLQNWDDLTPWKDQYYQFFFDIIESKLDPKPRILMPTLLLSEIVNTYLRKFAIPEYRMDNAIPPAENIDFKKDYRPTQHYKDSYEKIMDDIGGLHSSIEYVDDGTIADHTTLCNKSIGIFDYNDYLYYSLCKELNKARRVVLLTNDSDFQIRDIEIITGNRTLLELR